MLAPSKEDFVATPHPSIVWQTDKTAALIDFVREAEQALATQGDLEPDERYKLEAKIGRLKEGSESLEDDETLGLWLERLRDHHP